jgi:hypothetical protein
VGRDTEFNFGWNAEQPTQENATAWDQDTLDELWAALFELEARARWIGNRVSELMLLLKEKNMLPRSDSNDNSSQNSGGRRGGSQDGLPRLTTKMLNRTPREARIIAVRALEGKFGPQVLLKLALDGQSVLWYLGVKNNPCFKALEHEFGNEENDWAQKTILLHNEQDEVTEQYFMRVTFPKEGKATGRR